MAKGGAKLEGLDRVMRNLNQEILAIKGRTVGGMLKGARVVLREAQRRVPVEYGDLKNSGYASVSTDGESVDIGFTAPYAVAIHENMEQKLKGKPRPSGIGKYWGPSGEPKYLQNAVTAKKSEVLRIVAEDAKIERKKS